LGYRELLGRDAAFSLGSRKSGNGPEMVESDALPLN
jgi:hypothetical protein